MRFLFIMLLLALPVAHAASIMPLDCTTGTVGDAQHADCLYGTGFAPHQEMDLYVIDEQDAYVVGSNLTDVSETVEHAQADGRGLLKAWRVLQQALGRAVDFVADLNRNGKLDADDVLNAGSPHLQQEPVPEPEDVPEFSTLASLFVLIGVGIYISRRRSAA